MTETAARPNWNGLTAVQEERIAKCLKVSVAWLHGEK